MNLSEYMEAEGLDDEQMAERMADLLGRPITAKTVANHRQAGGRRVPKSWVSTLGLDEPEPGPDAPGPARAPRMPEGAPQAPVPAIVVSVAKERIAGVYETVGYAASRLTDEPGIRVVTDDYAPHIADAWIRAAEENEFARRVVRVMSSGGAVGELVTCHLLWLLGIAYVTGRVDDPTGLLARKYKPLHDAAVARHEKPIDVQAYADRNGQGAGDAVGEPPSTSHV